jgi:hypothetical protein
MFPYLSFSVVAFVLLAGFGLGILLGWGLRDGRFRFFDGDGGELIPLPYRDEGGHIRWGRKRFRVAAREDNVIPFPKRKAS